MRNLLLVLCLTGLITSVIAQPKTPVEKWKGKKILFIGAHPDDDTYAHGTLAMLQANGNEVFVAILTTGNVGTQDLSLSKVDLAKIRLKEEIDALAAIGIDKEHYINLGYDDGLLEYEPKIAVLEKLVRMIREIAPDVVFSFDVGKSKQRWHKADHRTSAYLTADAARAAMWPLLFQGQIVIDGLKAHTIPEYLFYDSHPEDINTWVDITPYKDKVIDAALAYVSQFSSAWRKYEGPILSKEEEKKIRDRQEKNMTKKDGKILEGFRYYKGLPDGIGR